MFITWLIIFTVITGGILYASRDDVCDFLDWLAIFFVCLLCVGVLLLIIFAIGSQIATNCAQIEYTTTTVGTIANGDNTVIITNDGYTNVTIATYDSIGKLSIVEYDYNDCLFENSTKNIIESHEYDFTNKITRIFFNCMESTDYTIKTTSEHIIDGTRIG